MKFCAYATIFCALLATGCGTMNDPKHPSSLPLRYRNAQYDFIFFLPASWQGFSAQVQPLKPAYSVAPESGQMKMIILRNPQWTASTPCHDIHILVFTRSQWDADKHGKLGYGAGGFEDEVSHNDNYVFATWSRDWADELKGWEEAEQIVEKNRTAAGPHLYPDI